LLVIAKAQEFGGWPAMSSNLFEALKKSLQADKSLRRHPQNAGPPLRGTKKEWPDLL
jgi:hypothetical protein